jgi:hypothetical protein
MGGAFALLLAGILLLGSALIARSAFGLPGFLLGMGAGALGILVGSFGMLYLIAGVGLLNLQNWARILTLVLAGVGLLFSGFGVLGGLTHIFLVLAFRRLVAVAIDVLILWYLSQPHIQRAFHGDAPPTPAAEAR